MCKNILAIFNRELRKNIKDEYIKDNIIRSKALMYNSVCNKFPEFKTIFEQNFIREEFREVLYCIFKDLPIIPPCKNPLCNKHTNLRNFSKGFQIFCSNKCLTEWQKNDEGFKDRISKTKINYNHELRLKNNNLDIINDGNYYIIHDYCKHGDVRIYKSTYNKIRNTGNSFCIRCQEEVYNNYNPTQEDILSFQNRFPDFYDKHKSSMKYDWMMLYYPREFKILTTYFKKRVEPYNKDKHRIAELNYMFLHKLEGRNKCPICHKDTKFITSFSGYRIFCDEHMIGFNKSSQEIRLAEYIAKTGYSPVLYNFRDDINKEYDFYFPELNYAIEYNGCWWHNDKNKDPMYHVNKRRNAEMHGIKLLFIWEDEYSQKEKIVYSYINRILDYDIIKVDGNKCGIVADNDRTINSRYIKKNYLHDYQRSDINIYLHYNNDMVACLSFRLLSNGEYLMLYYVEKRGYTVSNGISILFHYFISNYEYFRIICNADCDILEHFDCLRLGFQETAEIDNVYFLYKAKRYKKGINGKNSVTKCYTSGIKIYEYEHE